MDFFKMDNWFLVFMFIVLGGFFVWAMQYILAGLKDSIHSLDESFQRSAEKVEKLIQELFVHRNDHETRISILERQCIKHVDEITAHGGRRWYDPAHRDKDQKEYL